jgi:hypothetical protein
MLECSGARNPNPAAMSFSDALEVRFSRARIVLLAGERVRSITSTPLGPLMGGEANFFNPLVDKIAKVSWMGLGAGGGGAPVPGARPER